MSFLRGFAGAVVLGGGLLAVVAEADSQDVASDRPSVNQLAADLDPPATSAPVSTTVPAPTTSRVEQRTFVAQVLCPTDDSGRWDWYDATFGVDAQMSTGFGHATINYGDGRTYRSDSLEDANANMFWHRYNSPGQFVVTLETVDERGTSVTSSCTWEWSIPASDRACDPNYTGCVPIASDVDCASGSGNGPAYVSGPVQVIGRDIYDLDRNGDGIGCEAG